MGAILHAGSVRMTSEDRMAGDRLDPKWRDWRCPSCGWRAGEACEHHWLPPVQVGGPAVCERCGEERAARAVPDPREAAPTSWAYEQVCAANERKRRRITELEAAIEKFTAPMDKTTSVEYGPGWYELRAVARDGGAPHPEPRTYLGRCCHQGIGPVCWLPLGHEGNHAGE